MRTNPGAMKSIKKTVIALLTVSLISANVSCGDSTYGVALGLLAFLGYSALENAKDEEVLARSLVEPAVFEILVNRYQDAFLRKARGVLNEKEVAEDVVQETFTKIYLAGSRFKSVPGASFKSWGYKILMNTTFTHYRKRKRQFEHTTRLEPEHYEQFSETDSRFEENEFKDLVAVAMTTIPKSLSKVLAMHFLEGKSQKEIAEAERTTVGAVKTRIYRAKKALKKANPTLL